MPDPLKQTLRQFETLMAVIVLLGFPGIDYLASVIDPVEWTQPRYCHQN